MKNPEIKIPIEIFPFFLENLKRQSCKFEVLHISLLWEKAVWKLANYFILLQPSWSLVGPHLFVTILPLH